MDGIVLIDKPSGWTSHDVVGKIRSILRQNGVQKPKVGHTGTLDPLATGLMVVVIGNYTKRASELSKLDKSYAVSVKLGEISDTGDAEGKMTKISARRPSLQQVKRVLEQFVGEIEQTPPAYSAIKVDGQRAYKLARQGKAVKLEPRRIKIHEITDVAYAYPELNFTTRVSSGTYIRVLAKDIGSTLETGGYMHRLIRLSVGAFQLKQAQSPSSLTLDRIQKQLITLP